MRHCAILPIENIKGSRISGLLNPFCPSAYPKTIRARAFLLSQIVRKIEPIRQNLPFHPIEQKRRQIPWFRADNCPNLRFQFVPNELFSFLFDCFDRPLSHITRIIRSILPLFCLRPAFRSRSSVPTMRQPCIYAGKDGRHFALSDHRTRFLRRFAGIRHRF